MSKTVILPYDPTWRALEWAKANCKSYITNQGLTNGGPRPDTWLGPGQIEYFFADERDATLFRLKWL